MREERKGLIIKTAKPTGGKAGKGFNKTSTVQVVKPESGYSLMLAHFRYLTADRESFVKAWLKARAFVDKHIEERKNPS